MTVITTNLIDHLSSDVMKLNDAFKCVQHILTSPLTCCLNCHYSLTKSDPSMIQGLASPCMQNTAIIGTTAVYTYI